MAGAKSPLEVPAAGGAGEIENLAREMEARGQAAGEGVGHDLFERDTAGGDHAFAEAAGGANGQRQCMERGVQPFLLRGGQPRKRCCFGDTSQLEQGVGKGARHLPG